MRPQASQRVSWFGDIAAWSCAAERVDPHAAQDLSATVATATPRFCLRSCSYILRSAAKMDLDSGLSLAFQAGELVGEPCFLLCKRLALLAEAQAGCV